MSLGTFKLVIREMFFFRRVVQQWKRLLTEVVEFLFKATDLIQYE